MLTKIGAEVAGTQPQSIVPQGVKNAFSGAGKVLGGAFTYGFPVYQYMSGEESIGGAVGSMAGGSLGAAAGNTLGNAVGHNVSVLGRTLRRAGGIKGKVLGNLLNWTGKGVGIAGGLAGGLFGWDAGSTIGNKYMPIHKRNIDEQTPQPMMPQPMMPQQIKQASAAAVATELSPTIAKYLFHGGGIAGAALGAYYGNKNFNEDKAARARNQRFTPLRQNLRYYYYDRPAPISGTLYPKQFYNVQQ